MLFLPKFVTRTMSIRLSLMIVIAIALLLLASLFVMFRFSRLSVKEEALENAKQTLDGTVQHIDNILLSVELATGNMYFSLLPDLNKPERMSLYCRKLVESNPYIVGCAIAFMPNYYPGRELFMTYVRRDSVSTPTGVEQKLIESDSYGSLPYTEQVWFTSPTLHGKPGWTDPLKEKAEGEAITSFCLPIINRQGQYIAVLAADVSIGLLSKIVLATKPSANSYCVLLARDGSYIVHPDTNKLLHQTAFTQTEQGADPTVKEAILAMLAGETGYKYFHLDGKDSYVFYKPFERAQVPGRTIEQLGWSVGVIYPEEDIFNDYNRLLYYVIAIAVIGLLLLFTLCRTVIHRQLLPLLMLTRSAQRIAHGNYDEVIPDSKQQDEIGRLQDNFQQMQQSLSAHVSELEQLTTALKDREAGLREAYGHAQEANRVKTTFLHNMTNQMMKPAAAIEEDVKALCAINSENEQQAADRLTEDITRQGTSIISLLNNMLDKS